MAKTILARVICAFTCGEKTIPVDAIVDGKKSDIAQLKSAGNVDDDPAAVEYALAQGGETIKLDPEDVAQTPEVQQAIAEAAAAGSESEKPAQLDLADAETAPSVESQ